MGRDFWYYWKDPEAKDLTRDEDGWTIGPERYFLDISISQHNDFIPGYGGWIIHYDSNGLKKKIDELVEKFDEVKKSDIGDLQDAIRVFYGLLTEMTVERKTDIWIHYN